VVEELEKVEEVDEIEKVEDQGVTYRLVTSFFF
jgi:hypothetical protein